MAVQILPINVIVVVLPIFCPRVVGRVDVNDIYLAAVRVEKSLKGMKVLGVDDCVERSVPTALDLSGGHKARIDGITKLGDNHEVFEQLDSRFRLWGPDQR